MIFSSLDYFSLNCIGFFVVYSSSLGADIQRAISNQNKHMIVSTADTQRQRISELERAILDKNKELGDATHRIHELEGYHYFFRFFF